jgi:hypothetical protein
MNNILIYTFFSYTKRSSKELYLFKNKDIDKIFIPNTFSTNKLLSLIPKYKYVIGIADNRKDSKKSRMDIKYVNRYGRNTILKDSLEYIYSNLDITLPNTFYKHEKTTNGPCNRSAYLIMNRIVDEKLDTKFGFCHLCKENEKQCIEEIIQNTTSL